MAADFGRVLMVHHEDVETPTALDGLLKQFLATGLFGGNRQQLLERLVARGAEDAARRLGFNSRRKLAP